LKVVFKTDKPISRNGIDIIRYKEGDEIDIDDGVGKQWIGFGWVAEVKPKPVKKFEPDETPEKPKKAGRPKKDEAE